MLLKVVILAGGRGTRILELTKFRPKPLIELAGYPLLWHIMNLYSRHGFNEFILCLGYKQEMIKEYFLEKAYKVKKFSSSSLYCEIARGDLQPWRVYLIDTGEDTETGGRLKRISKYLEKDEYFLLTYGDCLTDANLADEIYYHFKHRKLGTYLSVRPYPGHSYFKDSDDCYLCGGYFVLSTKILKLIEGDKTHLHNDIIEPLIQENKCIPYIHKGFWSSVETIKDKQIIENIFKGI
ncbi:NTP transferase domain-containing protein [Thermodesulfobacterium sp. TA1]|uniref:sugar phosphate nucleotidyltransferase n=1 Tax=Thermodesulfobacterium sp. TA1 TaxID=2234087 RepID=UPI0012318C08|nr:sugar phosphate nucleotidyltransferase [Thermodesulfobacterium sp. TA1]QER42856.1 NTP transferase domain-containing protein [Thermodesulfobacterium sp. TA1]